MNAISSNTLQQNKLKTIPFKGYDDDDDSAKNQRRAHKIQKYANNLGNNLAESMQLSGKLAGSENNVGTIGALGGAVSGTIIAADRFGKSALQNAKNAGRATFPKVESHFCRFGNKLKQLPLGEHLSKGFTFGSKAVVKAGAIGAGVIIAVNTGIIVAKTFAKKA